MLAIFQIERIPKIKSSSIEIKIILRNIYFAHNFEILKQKELLTVLTTHKLFVSLNKAMHSVIEFAF